MRTIKAKKHVIIGGGPSGLAIAKELQARGEDCLIVTKDVGGLTGSFKTRGFTFDYGGHVYTTADENVTAIMKAAGAKLHKKREAFYGFEERVPFPVQDNAKMLGVRIPPGASDQSALNLFDYSRKVLGDEFSEQFLDKFNERVWTIPTSEMDFDWVFGRIKNPNEAKKDWGMNSQFYYAPGCDIIEVMRDSSTPMLPGMTVASIGRDNDRIYAYSETYGFVAIEWPRDGFVFDTAGVTQAHAQETNDVVCVGIGFEGDIGVEQFHWVYPHLRYPIHRVTNISRYHDSVVPQGDYHSILLELPVNAHRPSYSRNAACLSQLRAMQFQNSTPRVKEFLDDFAGLKTSDNCEMVTFELERVKGYPIPVVGHRKTSAANKLKVVEAGIIQAGRWGSHSYFNLQHVLEDARVVVNFALGDEPAENYFYSNHYYQEKLGGANE